MLADYETIILMEERNDLCEEFREVSEKVLLSRGETKRYWVERRRAINKRVSEITRLLGDSKAFR